MEHEQVIVAGFPLALDRRYQAETHMWVLPTDPGRARIGMDPLGIETSGTLAQLSFVPVGTQLTAGRPFGQLEAAKFVGPLVSPDDIEHDPVHARFFQGGRKLG